MIPSGHPCNNAEREGLKYAKTPSMHGYIKLPVGRPTKTIDPSPPSADTAIAPATAATTSRASSVRVKTYTETRGSYNKNDDKSGQDA